MIMSLSSFQAWIFSGFFATSQLASLAAITFAQNYIIIIVGEVASILAFLCIAVILTWFTCVKC